MRKILFFLLIFATTFAMADNKTAIPTTPPAVPAQEVSQNPQLQQQVTNLDQSQKDLLAKITTLTSKISEMEAKTISLQATISELNSPSTPTYWINHFYQQFTAMPSYDRVLLVLLILILPIGIRLMYLLFRDPKSATTPPPSTKENAEDEGEYDFLASSEGTAAKLDLARAYLEMEDKNAARELILEIINTGNESQIAEAKKLLEKLQ